MHMSLAEPLSPQQHVAGAVRRWATPRAVMALMLREMSTRYGRSPGGFLWAVLEPLGFVMILGMGLSLLVRTPPLGSNFFLFYATGFMPFMVYQNVSLFVARSIIFSRPLLLYPVVTWVDAMIARFILNGLTGILVTYIMLAGILAVTDTRSVLNLPPIVLAMALALLLGLGIGALNCALIGLITSWDLIWSIASRPLFLASGVIFIYDDLPQAVQSILWFNPLMHVAGYMRMGFYPMYNADYTSMAYVIGFSLVTLTFGLLLLHRFNKDILNES